MQAGVLVGPAIGGLLIAYVGIGWCFVVDIVGLGVAIVLFAADAALPPPRRDRPRPAWPGIGEGIRYALSRRDLLGTYLVDLAAMLLAMPVVLFPALAEEVFGRPELLGLLYSAETVGALLATGLSGWTSRVHHHGRAIVLAAAAYGAFIALAGLMPTIWVALLLLHARRRRGHDLGGLPRHGLEPDHPREHARPAGRHRDAVLLRRPARRPGPRRHRRRPLDGPRARSSAAAWPASAGSLLDRGGAAATSGPTTTAPTSTRSPSVRPAPRVPPATQERTGSARRTTGRRERAVGASGGGVERSGSNVAATSSKTSHQSA